MRIAIFTDTYRPEINGVVTSIDTYREALSRLGHDVYVFAPRYFGRDPGDPKTIRFPSIPFPFPLMKERRLSAPGNGGMRSFGRLKFDVIHSQVPANMGIIALLCSWFWRVPHIHTYHTHYMEYTHYMPFPRSFARRAVIWIARHFCGRCQAVVVPSDSMATVVSGYGVDSPISVIPTGIDLSGIRLTDDLSSLFRRYGLGDSENLSGRHILTSVGRLGREKNIVFLLQAVAELRRRGENVHFIQIGDGPDRADLEAEIKRLGIADSVTFTGYVTRSDVLSFMAASELFIFASQTETQGLVLLESMAVGTPVVALHGSGITDLMDGGIGGIATRHDLSQFVTEIQRLTSDPKLRERKSAEAIKRAADFTVEKQALKLVELYIESMASFRKHGLPRYHHRERY